MDRERLTRILEEPGKVALEDLAGLKELTERYPWFSGAHLLLAVGEHSEGDFLFDERLRTAATHIPSRAVLFDRIGPTARPFSDARMVAPDGKPAPEAPMTIVPNDAPVAAEVPVTAEPAEQIEDPPKDPLERQYIEAALASSYELVHPYGDAAGAEHAPVPVEEAPGTPPPPGPIVGGSTASSSTNETSSNGKAITPSTRLRFTDWLSEPVRMPSDGSNGPVTRSPGTASSDGPVAEPEAPLDTGSLIDRFIAQQHPEPVPTAAFFTPQQAAKRSLEERMDLVTETLARIYEQQGNHAKAIATYRELALKYPAKSAYFAALVQKLEGRTNK